MVYSGKSMSRRIVQTLIFILVFNLTGCGTILYPERSGQRAGQLDVGVVVLDGLGLFLFFIPGVIAYAVDFSNHSIYLPAGRSKHKFSRIRVKGDLDQVAIENVLRAETVKEIDLERADVTVIRLKSMEDMEARFMTDTVTSRLAYAN